MNKWLVKSCSRNSSLLWQKINTFLGTVRDDYHWFNPANIFDRNTPTALSTEKFYREFIILQDSELTCCRLTILMKLLK